MYLRENTEGQRDLLLVNVPEAGTGLQARSTGQVQVDIPVLEWSRLGLSHFIKSPNPQRRKFNIHSVENTLSV